MSKERPPNEAAMLGAAVAMTVPSSISMKKAPAARRARPRHERSALVSVAWGRGSISSLRLDSDQTE
jgi:hypothetical protein